MISSATKNNSCFAPQPLIKVIGKVLLAACGCAHTGFAASESASPANNVRVSLSQEGLELFRAIQQDRTSNPIMPGADPHAVVFDRTLWIYPTWDDRAGDRFFAFSSTNLLYWERHGPVLDFDWVQWIKDDGQRRHYAWAPCLAENSGKFYFYYSVGPQQQTPSRIGVAVGHSPAGPFEDSGKPLLTGGDGFEAIDPMVFCDPISSRYYFYAGGSAGAKLRVFEMNPDLVSFAREVPVKTPPQFTEGAFMHYHEGTYYLSYSHGGWGDSSYSVHYATGPGPAGPWHYRGSILVSDDHHKGPGHHSIVQVGSGQNTYLVYHRWHNAKGNGPFHGSRQLAIERLFYDGDGSIRPIRMSGGSAEKGPKSGLPQN